MILAPLSKYPGEYEILDHAAGKPEGDHLYLRLSTHGEETTIRLASPGATETWVAFRIVANFDFDAVGVLNSYIEPLAKAGVPIMAFSSFLTDHILVKKLDVSKAVKAWSEQKIRILEQ